MSGLGNGWSAAHPLNPLQKFVDSSADEYTIGVFHVALVELESVEPAVFRLRGEVNPE